MNMHRACIERTSTDDRSYRSSAVCLAGWLAGWLAASPSPPPGCSPSPRSSPCSPAPRTARSPPPPSQASTPTASSPRSIWCKQVPATSPPSNSTGCGANRPTTTPQSTVWYVVQTGRPPSPVNSTGPSPSPSQLYGSPLRASLTSRCWNTPARAQNAICAQYTPPANTADWLDFSYNPWISTESSGLCYSCIMCE